MYKHMTSEKMYRHVLRYDVQQILVLNKDMTREQMYWYVCFLIYGYSNLRKNKQTNKVNLNEWLRKVRMKYHVSEQSDEFTFNTELSAQYNIEHEVNGTRIYFPLLRKGVKRRQAIYLIISLASHNVSHVFTDYINALLSHMYYIFALLFLCSHLNMQYPGYAILI